MPLFGLVVVFSFPNWQKSMTKRREKQEFLGNKKQVITKAIITDIPTE